jgi:hypothetical protein
MQKFWKILLYINYGEAVTFLDMKYMLFVYPVRGHHDQYRGGSVQRGHSDLHGHEIQPHVYHTCPRLGHRHFRLYRGGVNKNKKPAL